MDEYNVSVVVDGLDLCDNSVVDAIFEALPDAVPASVNGLTTVSSPVEAADAQAAARQLIRLLRSVLPSSARLVRLDQDLVSISDIAERTNRSRESIRLLADGARGPGRFPPPLGTVGNGIRMWPWAVVTDWFRDVAGEDLSDRGVPPDVAAVVDVALAGGSAPLDVTAAA